MAVKEWQSPHCAPEVKSFLCLAGYYQRFCLSLDKVARPFNVLSSKKTISLALLISEAKLEHFNTRLAYQLPLSEKAYSLGCTRFAVF